MLTFAILAEENLSRNVKPLTAVRIFKGWVVASENIPHFVIGPFFPQRIKRSYI